MAAKNVFVVGYTGETGKELVKELINCDAVQKLVLVGRREVKLDHESDKLVGVTAIVDMRSIDM